MINRLFLFLAIVSLLSSCASKKNILYFQGISDSSDEPLNYESRLKADDLLMIIVSGPDPEAVKDFNLSTISVTNSVGTLRDRATTQQQYQTYLIDNKGDIQFPVIGTIHLEGLTRKEALEKIIIELKKYVKDPIVNMRILNFKVSVLGEVVRSGTFEINTERITLPEAIAKAGDMTIYGNRKKVLIIREIEGKKTHNFVDMTSSDFINSPFYYLTQNDVVYVEPNKTKVNSSVIGPNITVAISALSLVITIIALSTR